MLDLLGLLVLLGLLTLLSLLDLLGLLHLLGLLARIISILNKKTHTIYRKGHLPPQDLKLSMIF